MTHASAETTRAYRKAYYLRHKERIKAKTRAYSLAHPEMIRKASLSRTADKRRPAREKEYEQKKLDRIAKGSISALARCDSHLALYRLHDAELRRQAWAHDAHVRRLFNDPALLYRWKYQNRPDFVASERRRTQMRKNKIVYAGLAEEARTFLNGKRKRFNHDKFLGYSGHELRVHLERQFVGGMSWDRFNRTGWHIDHIVPRKAFDLTTREGVRACWQLSNLRPLWAADNMRKGARVDHLV